MACTCNYCGETATQCNDCGRDYGFSDDTAADRIEALERENAELREHMEEINTIVDECEYDKKTRKTVDRLRTIAKEALA